MKLLLNPLLLTLILLTSTLYATPDCTKSLKTQDFVQRFYAVILGREADNAGMDDWTNQLLRRSATGDTIAQGFIFSAEYNIDTKSNTQYLNDLYAAFFNRAADTDGFNYWMNEIANGSSRNKVLYGFLHSAEFINLSNNYGIQAYEGAAFESTEITNFVQRFYSVILGRVADSGGLAYWTNKLSTGESTGSDIAKGFIFSAEYDIASKNNTQYINDLYSAFFNRPADTGGFNYWMNEIASGSSREDVLDGFLGSQEFINLTNSYGILAFTGAPQTTSNNNAPTAVAGSNQSLFSGQTVNLSGSASSDSDGTLSCYWWKEGSTLLASTENFSKSDFSTGTHTLTLTVVDDDGVSGSDSNVMTINPLDTDGDGIPDATDSDDDNDGILDVNDAFPLDATESLDTDGDGIGDNADNPRILQLTPTNGSTNASATANLSVQYEHFDTAISKTAGKKVQIFLDNGTLHTDFDVNVVQVSISGGDTVTVNPNAHLSYGKKHYVHIDAGAFKDSTGEQNEGIQTNNLWSFTVQSASGPCGYDCLDNCDLPANLQ